MAPRVEFRCETRIEPDHPCLAGHFPGQPVVPAVLLLDEVNEALRTRLGNLRLLGLPNAKFLQPIAPGVTIQIELIADVAAGSARFRCFSGGQLAAQGELRFTQLAPQ